MLAFSRVFFGVYEVVAGFKCVLEGFRRCVVSFKGVF